MMSDPASPRSSPSATTSRRDLLRLRFGAAEGADYWLRLHRPAMACRFEVTLSGEDHRHLPAVTRALDLAEEIEAALTLFRPTSDLVRLNALAGGEPAEVSRELFDLLWRCRILHGRTEGAFDITSTPLSRAWGFLARAGRLPSLHEIEAARALVGMDGVSFDVESRTVAFRRPGMELNLGGIGKGYALERMATLLRASGVGHALLSAGGSSVLALGGRGLGWSIDLRSRQVPGQALGRLALTDGALSTSAAGEQFVEVAGTRYGHVLDPRTGRPAAGILSATVVTADPTVAEALSTAFLVGGVGLAERFCASNGGVMALLTPDDGCGASRVIGAFEGARWEEGP
jgi:FAD:protein FMN transferase